MSDGGGGGACTHVRMKEEGGGRGWIEYYAEKLCTLNTTCGYINKLNLLVLVYPEIPTINPQYNICILQMQTRWQTKIVPTC